MRGSDCPSACSRSVYKITGSAVSEGPAVDRAHSRGFGAVLSGKPRYGIRTSAGSVLAVCYDDGIVSDRHGDRLLQASKDTPLFTAFAVLTVLTAGAVGNFYDRFLNHYVVDFIYVSLINFPVFNVADIYVTVSVAVFLLLYLLYYKDEDFAFLHKNAQKEESDG